MWGSSTGTWMHIPINHLHRSQKTNPPSRDALISQFLLLLVVGEGLEPQVSDAQEICLLNPELRILALMSKRLESRWQLRPHRG